MCAGQAHGQLPEVIAIGVMSGNGPGGKKWNKTEPGIEDGLLVSSILSFRKVKGGRFGKSSLYTIKYIISLIIIYHNLPIACWVEGTSLCRYTYKSIN
jgi:hypothetical protein